MIKAAYPSDDWGWAVQWINKNHVSLDINLNYKQSNSIN